ncbi:MAG: S41 family peptidase [Bacteroidales bacterium]|nr:S41 family peptidase [Bacteroidales bacterium]
MTVLLASLLVGCGKTEAVTEPSREEDLTRRENKAVNLFLKDVFGTWYYWIDSMKTRFERWSETDDPADAYSKFKHADDRWGFVSDRGDEIKESFDGVSTSYGYNGLYAVYKDTVVLVVQYVSPDTPASGAGIKRGDVFSKFNGKALIYKEGDDIDKVNAKLNEMIREVNSKPSEFTYAFTGKVLSMTPEKIYENPILVSKVFDLGGKKIAYLHYTQFELDALESLVSEFARYRNEGVSELILDLRYNGGGYLSSERLLASMIAPVENVRNEDVFSVTKYNSIVSAVMTDTQTRFAAKMIIKNSKGEEKTYEPLEANPDLKRLYVIMTGDTASASELLANGLYPYMDVCMFGENSYGKTASCYLFNGKDWYIESKDRISSAQYKDGITYASNWCAYVTVAYNVNILGEAKCCPNGFQIDADKAVEDNPLDGCQLGDPNETMLSKVLSFAGYPSRTKSLPPSCRIPFEMSAKLTTNKKAMLPAWGFAIE